MRIIFKNTRYYYWLISGFIRKYSKLMLIVFVMAFFALFFSRSIGDLFSQFFNFNKVKVGVLKQESGQTIPLEILQQVSVSIAGYDQKGALIPILAKAWQIKDFQKEYTFVFPKELKWQDGPIFKVSDIDLNLITFPNIKTEIINDNTLRFKLKKPLANFPSLLTTPIIKSNFVGIKGNYKIARIKYEYGELKYVNLIPVEPGLPYLRYKIYNTQDDLVLGYKLGEIDTFSTNDFSITEQFRSWRNTNIEEAVDFRRVVTLFINTSKAPFDNKNLRNAIALGIEYTKLTDYGEKAHSPIIPISWAYNSEVKKINYEPEISASLLENNVQDKPITLYTSYELESVAEIIKKSLKQAGFNISIRYLNYVPTDYELFLTVWEPPVDPDQYVFWHSTQRAGNFSKLKNVKIDKLLEDGRNESSLTKRKQIYLKFQDIIIEETPAVFIYFPKKYTFTRKI